MLTPNTFVAAIDTTGNLSPIVPSGKIVVVTPAWGAAQANSKPPSNTNSFEFLNLFHQYLVGLPLQIFYIYVYPYHKSG